MAHGYGALKGAEWFTMKSVSRELEERMKLVVIYWLFAFMLRHGLGSSMKETVGKII